MLSRGCDEFDRSDGIGHDYCCGDLDVIRVFTDSAGDGLLECCVRFQVDQEEADVCLKLLSKTATVLSCCGWLSWRSVRRWSWCSMMADNLSNCARMRCVLMRWAAGVSNASLEGV